MKKHNLPIAIVLSALLMASAFLPTWLKPKGAVHNMGTQEVQEIKELEQAELLVPENAATTDNDASVELVDADLLDFIFPAAINGTPVTAIGENAFFGCELFRTAVIPVEIIEIGVYAFSEYPYLDVIILNGHADT